MIKNTFLTVSSLIFLASCGGGGGGGASEPAPVAPSYSIASGNIYTSTPIPDSIYVDENMNGFKDSYEISVSPSTNGSFNISTSNQSKSSCLKNFPISSENPSIISLNNSQGNNVVINEFTSLYRMYLNNSSYYIDTSRRENDNNDCSILETYSQKLTQRSMNNSIKRMEIFDNHTYAQIAADPSIPPAGSEITGQRSQDISAFASSLNTIKNQITKELNDILSASNSNVTMVSNGFLDNSALRVFLNKDTYPNPSTDLSPVAQSISSIALPAYINFLGTWNDYAGTYDNTLYIQTIPFISSGGDIIQADLDCLINFTSQCKVNTTFTGILNSSNPTIYDILHKNTSRGTEKWEQYLDIYSDTNKCYRYERIGLTTTESNKVTNNLFRDGVALGNFNADDFDCYTYTNSNAKSVLVSNYHEDGTFDYIYIRYDSFLGEPVIFQPLPNRGINYDEYTDTNPPPEQIPSEYINVFQQIGSNQMTSFLAMISNSDFYSGGGGGTLIAYFIRTPEGREGNAQAFFSGYNNVSISCNPIDGETTGENITTGGLSSTNIFDLCKSQLVNSYVATSSAPDPSNISPFRGEINE